jgi:hypothetical protein
VTPWLAAAHFSIVEAKQKRFCFHNFKTQLFLYPRGLKALGSEVVKGLRFVCGDLWKPYLNVLAAEAGPALHILDRFHLTMHLNQAVAQVWRAEGTRLRAASGE